MKDEVVESIDENPRNPRTIRVVHVTIITGAISEPTRIPGKTTIC
jgi:hypothetical protein